MGWTKYSGFCEPTCACDRLPCSSPQLTPSRPSTMCIRWACTLVCRNTMHLSQNVRLTRAGTHNMPVTSWNTQHDGHKLAHTTWQPQAGTHNMTVRTLWFAGTQCTCHRTHFPDNPSVQLQSLTSVCTLKVPNTGSHTIVWYTGILHALIGMGSTALAAAVSYLGKVIQISCKGQ